MSRRCLSVNFEAAGTVRRLDPREVAEIEGITTDTLRITGVDRLHGATHRVDEVVADAMPHVLAWLGELDG